ncbi:hypothetical protein BH09PLA1_BH09PLA1_12660 [soil metagenome]
MRTARRITLDESLAIFRRLQRAFRADRQASCGLLCKVGKYNGSAVIKLQKRSWTNDPMNVVENRSGIFFSVWVDEKSLSRQRACYNIHALKLHELQGYDIGKSTDFASAFRRRFERGKKRWPNVSVDFGPLTLMQGWIRVNSPTFPAEIDALLRKFIELSPTIDHLLEASKRTPNRPHSVGRRRV